MPRIVILDPEESINEACQYAGKGGFVLLQKPIKLPGSHVHINGNGATILGHQNGRFEFEDYIVTVARKRKAKVKVGP
jgi:hypothetical protein